MIIDFHVHGKITSSFPFDKDKFLETIHEAKSEGINSLAITEHLDSKDFLEGYSFLNENYSLVEDYYNIDDFKVFYGIEVTTAQNLDILIIGYPRLILEVRDKIINRLNGMKFIDINLLFEIDGLDQLLIILAHPYRNHDVFPSLDNEVIERIDAIELNSKDLYKNGIDCMKTRVMELADKLKLPIVCGSDTHHFMQMGSVKNIFKDNLCTVNKIKERIKLGEYSIELSDKLIIRVKSAIIIKKLICNK